MAGSKRQISEINAGSVADIAFLLLIFFLVATTMNTETGLVRVLPQLPPEDQQQENIDIKERNLFSVMVDGSGRIRAGIQGKQENIDISALKGKAREFVLNPMDDETFPEKKTEEFTLPDGSKWNYNVSQGVISLQTTRDTDYHTYIQVQNELTRAFNELRDELAMSKFGNEFADLDKAHQDIIAKAIPLKVSEAEPINIKK